MTEKEFQSQVIQLARLRGWLVHHTPAVKVARGNGSAYFATPLGADPGVPDLLLAHPCGRVLFAEIKVKGNKPTDSQRRWLDTLGVSGGVEVYLWRETDWAEIVRKLGG